MKLPLKITGVFLIFALLTSCVAATENKDLPTKEEITDFIAGIPVSDNYITTVFDAVKDKQPGWNCDTWVDKNGDQILSLYYVDPDSAKGYSSIYFNELGNEISVHGVEIELVNHYVGKAVSEEIKEDVKGTEENETVTETEEEETDPIENEETSTDPENIASGPEEYRQTDTVNNYSDNGQTNTETTTVNNYYYNEPKETESEDTPAEEPEASSASVNLHGEKTKVLMGEDILLRLSAVNLITKPTMHVQAIIIPPSGMSVSSTEFVESGAGQYTTTYDLEPGKGRDIEVRIAANQVGDFNVTGRVVYYFGNNKESGEDKTLDLPIHVEDPNSEPPTPEDKSLTITVPDMPGFGAVSLVMILMLVSILKRK